MKTKQQIELINKMLMEKGQKPLTDGEVVDWCLEDGIPKEEVIQMVRDYLSELHSNECDKKHYEKYGY